MEAVQARGVTGGSYNLIIIGTVPGIVPLYQVQQDTGDVYSVPLTPRMSVNSQHQATHVIQDGYHTGTAATSSNQIYTHGTVLEHPVRLEMLT